MGEQNVATRIAPAELRGFIKQVLTDLRALEKMIASGIAFTQIRK